MSNLKSEVLFNRALLWLVLAELDRQAGIPTWAVAFSLACAAYNVVMSFMASREVDA